MFSITEVWGLWADGSNPCCYVKRYKKSKRERFLSPEETERLGEVLREARSEMPSAVAASRLLLLTGCRPSEIQFLRWEYAKDECIELSDANTGGRVVPLEPEARAVLVDLPREDGNPCVIRGKLSGSQITDLQRPWRRIRAGSDLEDARICDLRHLYASRALGSGESLTMIGKLLGYTRVQTAARYTHLARDSVQNAAARISGYPSAAIRSKRSCPDTASRSRSAISCTRPSQRDTERGVNARETSAQPRVVRRIDAQHGSQPGIVEAAIVCAETLMVP